MRGGRGAVRLLMHQGKERDEIGQGKIQGQAQVPGKERIPQGQAILLLIHWPPAGPLSSTLVTDAQDLP